MNENLLKSAKLLRRFTLAAVVAVLGTLGVQRLPVLFAGADAHDTSGFPVQKSEEEWRQALTKEQYHVLREAGTERAFTGEYHDNHAPGLYVSASTGQPLFRSTTKFDSGTGWPSFWEPYEKRSIVERTDLSLGIPRTEVVASLDGGHLGHVFPDGPKPTGLRYCINSAALKFIPEAEVEDYLKAWEAKEKALLEESEAKKANTVEATPAEETATPPANKKAAAGSGSKE